MSHDNRQNYALSNDAVRVLDISVPHCGMRAAGSGQSQLAFTTMSAAMTLTGQAVVKVAGL
ncbi:MAG: hypothetical protein ABF780_06645 [Bifidobacterium aquikefiri]|uniref:hypothetical protein n=1 Tax=Bifidobacterium aquikefiri TaxID=1653207 RepID=UPI000B9A4A6E